MREPGWPLCQATACVLLLSTLAACGGGSGTSGSGSAGGTGTTGAPHFSATLDVTPITVSANADITQVAPSLILTVFVETTSSDPVYLSVSTTHTGVATLNEYQDYTDSGTSVDISFQSPATLGPGTYHDTVTLIACYDSACSRPISNSQVTVPVTYTVTPPVPTISSLSPVSIGAGAPGFTLMLQGTNYQSNSQVLWNGSPRTTTYVSTGQLTAQITTADIATGGTASVQVENGSLQSSAKTYTINPLAALTISQVSPTQVAAGASSFYVSAIGTGFASSSAITWNGNALTTTYVSSTLLRALVDPSLIAASGTASIAVANSASQGGSTGALTLSIVASNTDATAYQMNPAHTGAVNFRNVALPSGSTWSVDVGGAPSYALIVDGRVFVTAGGPNTYSATSLLALDGATGAVLWGPIALAGYGNLAYDNGRLFVTSGGLGSELLQALDPATGNPLWAVSLSTDSDPAPPVAAGGTVYIGTVAAYDETAGALLWSTGTDGTDGIVAVTADGVYRTSACVAYDFQPAVGVLLWTSNAGCGGGGGATPVLANGTLYWPESPLGQTAGETFDAESGAVLSTFTASSIPAVNASSGFFLNNATLTAQANSNNQVLWTFEGDGQLTSSPIVVNNYVFIGSGSGKLYALNATTGAQVWTQTLSGAVPVNTSEFIGGLTTGLAAGDGLLIVPNGTKVTAFTLSTSP